MGVTSDVVKCSVASVFPRPHRAAPLHAEVYIHLGGRVAECAALSPQLAGGGDVAGWVEGELSAFPSIFSGKTPLQLRSADAVRTLFCREGRRRRGKAPGVSEREREGEKKLREKRIRERRAQGGEQEGEQERDEERGRW
ncbi:hypothetical protein TGVEG_281575 [Toxoplasma gondii VEG]|uniref:Uncharacterized protein n=1 Tax=Toxoplasma gondii (strain ATCC 50861 / VEG) TaxID=432359 RepID=V5BBJ6_TOXGV|nr:hypothetical protein TGVEG_281575 [Toxoplasma gondii VEG]